VLLQLFEKRHRPFSFVECKTPREEKNDSGHCSDPAGSTCEFLQNIFSFPNFFFTALKFRPEELQRIQKVKISAKFFFFFEGCLSSASNFLF